MGYLQYSKPALTVKVDWLTWPAKDFANIDNSKVATLLFVARTNDLGLILKPAPIKQDDRTLIGIIGNMFDEKTTLAFIKIEGDEIGSCCVIQGLKEVPNQYCPEIPLQANMIIHTIWEES